MQIQYSSCLTLYRFQLVVFIHQTVLLKGLSPEMGIWICDEIDLGLNESRAWSFNVLGICNTAVMHFLWLMRNEVCLCAVQNIYYSSNNVSWY